MRPGPSPLAVLEARLQHAGVDAKGLANKLAHDRNALANLLQLDAAAHGPLLIVIDQLEELFTLCQDPDERQTFAEALVGAVRTPDDPIRIVFTLRDDFLVRAEQVPALRNRIGQSLQLLTVPQPEDLLRILIEPARRAGYEFEDPQLPAEMVRELADQPGALALLSFTAAKLWELRDRHFKQLTRKAYRSLGGVGGALARHAEQTLADMLPEEQHLTRESFRHLVTTQNTRAVLGRSELRQLLGESHHADAVIEKLVAARLFVASENEVGAEIIEIVHEALLGAWPRLVEWRREDIDGARFREQLRAAAKQWVDRGRAKGLLWRGDALADYTRWRARHPGPLTDDEHAFANASIGDAARGRRIQRGLVAAAFAVLGAGILVLTSFNATKEEQRQNASVAQARAETSERRALEDHGRQLLLDGDPIRAAVYLDAAKRAGASSPALTYLLNRSLAILQKRKLVLAGHQGTVHDGLYSNDGHRAFTSGEDHTARAWDTTTGGLLVTYTGHSDVVRLLALAPDGVQLATGSLDGTARLWDANTGRVLHTLRGHKGSLQSLRFSPNGKHLATAGDDRTVRIWNVATGAQVFVLEGHKDSVTDLWFTRDGSQLFTVSRDHTLVLWNANTGTWERVLDEHADPARRLAASADGRLVASGGEQNTVRIWDVEAGVLRRNIQLQAAPIQAASVVTRRIGSVFSPDSRSLAIPSGREVSVWDVSTGGLRFVLRGHISDLTSVVFSPDGARIASSSNDGSVRIWDVGSGEMLSIIPSTQAILWTSFAPDGRELLIGGSSGVVETWSTHSDGLVRRLTGLGENGTWVSIRPDHTQIAACGENGAIRVWDFFHEEPVFALAHGANCEIAYSRTGTRLVTGGDDGRLQIWDSDGAKVGTFHRDVVARVDSVAASRDQVLAGSSDGQVQIWDLATGTIAKSFIGHSLAVYAVAWGPSGSIASCGRDATARIWNVTTGTAMRVLKLDGPCVCVALSPDGSSVVTATNKHAQIWSRDSSQPVALEGHQNTVTGAMFAMDGLVVTTSDDATVGIWDATGRQLDTLPFPSPVTNIDIVDTMMVVVSGQIAYVWQFPIRTSDDAYKRLIDQLPFTLENGLLVSRKMH
jgi:WD40 repeat protein